MRTLKHFLLGFVRLVVLTGAVGLLAPSDNRAEVTSKGNLLWQDVFSLAKQDNEALSVATERNRIFVAGTGQQSNSEAAWVVRSYEASTGKLLWRDVLNPGGGNAVALGIAVHHNLVAAAGAGNTTEDLNSSLWIVKAYHAPSGELRWQDQFDNAGRFAEARAIAVTLTHVIAAGRATGVGGEDEWLVRAYDTWSGALKWEDRRELVGKDQSAQAITVMGDHLFVAGGAINSDALGDWMVRAYDIKSGTLLWEDQLGEAGGFFSAFSITAQDGTVFAAGTLNTLTEGNHWIVRAYQADSGNMLWEDRFNTGSGPGARSITTSKSGVFATGGIDLPTDHAMLVKAYDPTTGAPQWQDRIDFDRAGTGGTAITIKGHRVYAVGAGPLEFIEYWFVRMYDGRNGEIHFEDQFNLGGNTNIPSAVVAQHLARFFAVGDALALVGGDVHFQWVVRAYDPR